MQCRVGAYSASQTPPHVIQNSKVPSRLGVVSSVASHSLNFLKTRSRVQTAYAHFIMIENEFTGIEDATQEQVNATLDAAENGLHKYLKTAADYELMASLCSQVGFDDPGEGLRLVRSLIRIMAGRTCRRSVPLGHATRPPEEFKS